jgi:hypothetical protein
MPVIINPSAISLSQNGTVHIEESYLASFVASNATGVSPMMVANPQCKNDACANSGCTGSNTACGNVGCGT